MCTLSGRLGWVSGAEVCGTMRKRWASWAPDVETTSSSEWQIRPPRDAIVFTKISVFRGEKPWT